MSRCGLIVRLVCLWLYVCFVLWLPACAPVQTVKRALVGAPTATVRVSDLTLLPGETGIVSLTVEDAVDLNTVSVTLNYDPNLVCVADCLGNPNGTFKIGTCEVSFDHLNDMAQIKVTMSADGAPGPTSFTGNAVLGNITLRSVGPEGTNPLIPEVVVFVGPPPEFPALGVATVNGNLTVAQATPTPTAIPTPIPTLPACCGDSDGNGSISTSETTTAILALVNRDPASDPAAQCSMSGNVTTADVTKVILNLVNRTCTAVSLRRAVQRRLQ